MTAGVVIENYRQLAFVSSLLAGFAFTFYGVLLTTSTAHRVSKLGLLPCGSGLDHIPACDLG
jgi:hypothetical protein